VNGKTQLESRSFWSTGQGSVDIQGMTSWLAVKEQLREHPVSNSARAYCFCIQTTQLAYVTFFSAIPRRTRSAVSEKPSIYCQSSFSRSRRPTLPSWYALIMLTTTQKRLLSSAETCALISDRVTTRLASALEPLVRPREDATPKR